MFDYTFLFKSTLTIQKYSLAIYKLLFFDKWKCLKISLPGYNRQALLISPPQLSASLTVLIPILWTYLYLHSLFSLLSMALIMIEQHGTCSNFKCLIQDLHIFSVYFLWGSFLNSPFPPVIKSDTLIKFCPLVITERFETFSGPKRLQ